AEGLDLVVVARPEFTLEVGGRSRAELIGAGHDPWLAKRPLGRRRYRRRHVDAGGGLRPVAFWQVGAIVGAPRQDGGGGPFADCDPFLLRRAIGDGGQGRLRGATDRHLLRRCELCQYRAIRSGDRRVDRRARGRVQRYAVWRIAPGNGVHGFVDGRLDDG